MMREYKNLLAISFIMLSGGIGNNTWAAQPPSGVILAEKQELVKNNGSEVATLDPNMMEGSPETAIVNDLMEGLTSHDPLGNVQPGVAERWENEDWKVWTFYLRKDAKWSNGEPVTAHDFVYSWQRIVNPETASPYASYFSYAHVENVGDIIAGKKDKTTLGVKALDDHTLQVRLSQRVPYFVDMTSHSSMKPVFQKVIEQFGDRWTLPGNYVSNGAYQLKSWVVNERIVLERNPMYWDNANTVINQVTYLTIESANTDVNRYRAGEIDITAPELPIEIYSKLQKELPNELKTNPLLCTYYYELNNQRPPLNDARVRAALKLGLDREIITKKVKNQGEVPAYSFTPPYTQGMKLITPKWYNESQEERNNAAKKLLAEAGYGPDKPLTFSLLYNTSEGHKKLAIAAAAMWKQNLGAQVKLENQEWKTYIATRRAGNYDVARGGWCGDYNEPSSFLNIMYSNSSNNTSHYKSSEFDKMLAQALEVSSEDERAAVYQQAEQYLDQDSVIVPVYYYVVSRLVKPNVGGYVGKDPQDYLYTKDLYIIKQ